MAENFSTKLKHAWNAFFSTESTTPKLEAGYYHSYGYRPEKQYKSSGGDRSTLNTVINRIAVDAASAVFQHTKVDQNGRYTGQVKSSLNECLTLEANKDQTSFDFFEDLVYSICDEGVAAIVPVDVTLNPDVSNTYDYKSFRVGEILDWYPDHVRVRLYNDRRGQRQEVVLKKSFVAIITNPFYAVMNEPNSTLKRLIRKLALLDIADEKTSSGKMDLIIQLPYVIKTESRRQEAEKRRADIEMQLTSSRYGIAYTDGTEKITQLNRPVENNLFSQITYLTGHLYNQLGLTEDIFKGTANEEALLNYFNRTIEPILNAIALEMNRKFLTKTARSQGHKILYFRDPFKLVPISALAELADKFTRNEILTGNEFRGVLGIKPSDDPNADQLRNKNLNPAAPPPDQSSMVEQPST